MGSCLLCGSCNELVLFNDKGEIVHLCRDEERCLCRIKAREIRAKGIRKNKPLPPSDGQVDRRTLSAGD